MEALFVVVIAHGWLKQSVFVLNIYSPPLDPRQTFISLLRKATSIAKHSPLIVTGDFNAPHNGWGYVRQTVKGENLARILHDLAFTVITDPGFPTRLGKSVARDTTPDLACVRNVSNVTWANKQENLGRTDFIAAVNSRVDARPFRVFRVTDWHKFRKLRKERTSTFFSFGEAIDSLTEDVERATKVVQMEAEVPRMDPRLAHLLEAKSSILTRWKTQRLNRRLRKRLRSLIERSRDIARCSIGYNGTRCARQ